MNFKREMQKYKISNYDYFEFEDDLKILAPKKRVCFHCENTNELHYKVYMGDRRRKFVKGDIEIYLCPKHKNSLITFMWGEKGLLIPKDCIEE